MIYIYLLSTISFMLSVIVDIYTVYINEHLYIYSFYIQFYYSLPLPFVQSLLSLSLAVCLFLCKHINDEVDPDSDHFHT